MESEREERKRSIRAARDWLAGAEDALAGADDVSGDLKLMLARAELACTTSTRRARLRRRARILLPALAVIALALWGLWYAQVQEPAAVPASAEIEERAEIPAAQSPVEEAPVPAPQPTVAAACDGRGGGSCCGGARNACRSAHRPRECRTARCACACIASAERGYAAFDAGRRQDFERVVRASMMHGE